MAAELLSRVPPQHLDAERAVLGAVLIEGVTALHAAAEVLRPDDFYTDAHREVYAAMLRLDYNGKPVELLTVQEELRRSGNLQLVNGPSGLALIMEQGSVSAYLPAYTALVRSKAALREMIQGAVTLITEAYDDQEPATDLLERHLAAMAVVSARAAVAADVLPVERLDAILAADIPPREFHVTDWLVRRGLTFMVGDSEAFKSWLANYIGICKASGRPWFDRHQVTAGPALIISEENGRVEDRRRLWLMAKGMGLDPAGLPLYIASEHSFNFDDPGKYAALRALIKKLGIQLLLVDSFIRVHKRKEADSGEMNALYMDRFRPVIRDGCDLLLLHHKRKLPAGLQGSAATAAGSDGDDIRGSGDIRASADAVLFLKNLTKNQVVVRQNKTRGWEKQDPFVFSVSGSTAEGQVVFKYEGKPEDVLDKSGACKEAILAYAQEHATGFRRAELEHHFRELKKAGRPTYSRKVFDPVLEDLSKKGYPLRRDEYGNGKRKMIMYHYVVDDETAEGGGASDEPGSNDVPF